MNYPKDCVCLITLLLATHRMRPDNSPKTTTTAKDFGTKRQNIVERKIVRIMKDNTVVAPTDVKSISFYNSR